MYLKWKEITVPDLSDATLTNLYSEGFVLTRKGKGAMDQTRSLRLDLSKFVLSSENRRVLKKTEGLELQAIPLPYTDYTWEIGKLGKDFYEDKFGAGTFSANKIKELLTDQEKSNFNTVLVYQFNNTPVGHTITYQNSDILHYSYPFYDRATDISNLGLGMMLRAILHAQESGKKYIYLGSAQRPTDIYKLQFAGLEWFDGEKWQTDEEALEKVLKSL
jgi:arginyl-tRNA--protein-N-Asp/Glu arginylyltransferase